MTDRSSHHDQARQRRWLWRSVCGRQSARKQLPDNETDDRNSDRTRHEVQNEPCDENDLGSCVENATQDSNEEPGEESDAGQSKSGDNTDEAAALVEREAVADEWVRSERSQVVTKRKKPACYRSVERGQIGELHPRAHHRQQKFDGAYRVEPLEVRSEQLPRGDAGNGKYDEHSRMRREHHQYE